MMQTPALPESLLPGLTVAALDASAEPLLQRFFDANPEYFLATTGQVASPDDAHDELNEGLPEAWPYSAITRLGYFNAQGELAAMANVVSDLFASGIWHISTFIVETARHGRGDAQALYQGIEQWAAAHGARFMRLGVVLGHHRAERFWERQGYLQTRLRHGVDLGGRLNTLRVMCKPLAGGSLEAFLQLVERDRPEPGSSEDKHLGSSPSAGDAPAETSPPALNAFAIELPQCRGSTRLRSLRLADLPRFAAYRADPGLAKYQSWEPMSRETAASFLHDTADATHLQPGGWIQLAVADLASDELVGDVGLFLSDDGRSSELGFTLARAEQGKGHATRAAELAVELLFRHAPVLEVRAIADQRHQASMAVLRRAGFVQTGTREALFKEEACTEVLFERRRAA